MLNKQTRSFNKREYLSTEQACKINLDLTKKVVINSSDFFCEPYLKKKVFFQYRAFFSHFTVLCKNIVHMHRLNDVLQFF